MVLATAARTRWERAEVPWSRSRASAGSAGVSELVAMRAAPSPCREVTVITLRAARWFRKRTARSARPEAFPALARRERASGGGREVLSEADDGVRGVGLLEPGDLLAGELDVDGGDGVVEVGVLGDADDGRGDHRLGQHPRERHPGPGDAALPCDLGDPLDDPAVAALVVERVAEGGRLRPAGRLVPVPGEPAAGQRAPRDHADALVGAERVHLPLLLAVEQVVVVLHRHEPVPAVLARHVQGLAELPGPHGGGAEVADLAAADGRVQRLEGLLDRRAGVPAVDLVQVDVVGAEPPEAVVELPQDRLAGEPRAVGAGVHPAVHLGGQDDVVAVGEVADRPAGDLLAGAVGVDVRGVEEGDPAGQGLLDEPAAVLLAEGPGVVAPVRLAEAHHAETDAGHLETGVAQTRVLHVPTLVRGAAECHREQSQPRGRLRAVNLDAAVSFVTGSARLLDRRRLDLLLGTGTPEPVLAALDGYANPDGGFGWGLEPDLRCPESQPAGAMHALEALHEAAAADSARVPALLDWLQRRTLPDGGLPFALPMRDRTASAPFWAGADPTTSALQTTSQVAAQAHRLARHRPDVAASPWLRTATAYCLAAIDRMDTAPPAHELLFAVRFADAVHGAVPAADGLLDRLGRYLPADGTVPVAGGSPGEALRPLNFSPDPDGASRTLLA